MTFDAGTWWLIGIVLTALIASVTYLIKISLFGRIDKCEKAIGERITKEEHTKDIDVCKADIKKIKEDYATRSDLRDLRQEIKSDLRTLMDDVSEIRKNSISRDDFIRAQVSNEQNFQRMYDLFLKNGGAKRDG